MDAELKNLSATVKLLAAVQHPGAVERLDEGALSRAFQWARHCERLFCKFHNNPAIRRTMEQQLQITNQSLRAAFPGITQVSFNDLSRCQHLLSVGLLNNPKLPSSIMKTLFDARVNTKQRDLHDNVAGFCGHAIQRKAACEVLSKLEDRSAVGAEAEIQGAMLMEKMDALLRRGNEAGFVEHVLDSVLEGCEGEAGRFCVVVAAALQTAKRSAAQSASRDFLLQWLQKKPQVLQLVCSALPVVLLAELAREDVEFRDAYCAVLKGWASDTEYSLSDGEWIQTGTDGSVSFQRLAERFLALCEACPSLKEDVEQELKALKVSDGDFDVRGLSVWGDLLSALNK
ncbi:Fanconi anemia group F protein [Brachionichthys hirsutus]|uniref:Fanconi anemia group F protein n=1 Tax=Brachionichthys hirsutus TaxID=412623 RepID=UPI0036047D35